MMKDCDENNGLREKIIECDKCNSVVGQETGVKLPIENSHDESEVDIHITEQNVNAFTDEENEPVSSRQQYFKCNTCNLTFKSEAKLKEHMCRIHIENPTYGYMYMKNWIVHMNCTTIYDRNKQAEVAFLHSAECVTNVNRCTTNLPIWFPAQEDKTGGIWHLELEKSIDDSGR